VKAPSQLSTEIMYKEVHYQATACLCRCQTAPCFLSYIAMTKITAELMSQPVFLRVLIGR
jgi:hypothetical protein